MRVLEGMVRPIQWVDVKGAPLRPSVRDVQRPTPWNCWFTQEKHNTPASSARDLLEVPNEVNCNNRSVGVTRISNARQSRVRTIASRHGEKLVQGSSYLPRQDEQPFIAHPICTTDQGITSSAVQPVLANPWKKHLICRTLRPCLKEPV